MEVKLSGGGGEEVVKVLLSEGGSNLGGFLENLFFHSYHKQVFVRLHDVIVSTVIGLPELRASEVVVQRLVRCLLIDVDDDVITFMHVVVEDLKHPITKLRFRYTQNND